MASQVAFSSSDDIITKDNNVEQITVADPEDYFEVRHCIEFLQKNNFGAVALQFPDELMNYAQYIYKSIEKAVSIKIYILADTSYGSCCVDEVAASHVNADVIIHFGHSCLSATENLPILYIFGRSYFDYGDFKIKLDEIYPDKKVKSLLFYDESYHHYIDTIYEDLSDIYSNMVITYITSAANSRKTGNVLKYIPTDSGVSECNIENCFGRIYSLQGDVTEYDILYIGPETLTLRNLIFKFNKNKVYSYNADNKEMRLENIWVNKSLMKRFYLIEKAKDSNIVGIVMGTLGVTGYKEMVTRLKSVLKHAGKKFYTFIIGKINVAKMANFMEIDIFVLISCPENSLVESKEFYKPIVTPYEMEIACLQTRKWTGDYITDFCEILPGALFHVEIDAGAINDKPEYSLITGQLRSNPKFSNLEYDSSSDLTIRNKDNQLLPYSAGEYLSSRSWQGLEVNSGKSEVEEALEGRIGIAMGYRNELNA